CRSEGNDSGGGVAQPCALVGPKVEELVFFDRSAHAAAELIAFERVLHGGEELTGVQISIAKKVKQTAVDLVRARARDNVDDAAAGIAVFRGEVTRLE